MSSPSPPPRPFRRRRRAARLLTAAFVTCALTGRGQEARTTDEKTWNRRTPGTGNYQIVMEVSGRDQLHPFLPPPADPGRLESVCEARREGVAMAIPTEEQYLASLLAVPAADQVVPQVVIARHDLGQLWAYRGRMDKAIAETEAALKLLTERSNADPAYLEAVLGVLNLRGGELENCLHDHNPSRCIFPIQGPGEHTKTAGSEAAFDYFLRHLRRNPGNLEIRWLLNVAAMTLGRYPDGVPREQLIPPSALASAEDPGSFPDVAHRYGLDAPGRAGGALVEDLDGDGFYDVVVSSVDPCAPLRYYHNDGDGSFSERANAAGLEAELGGINLVQTDYDNDGRPDIFVMRGGWEFPIRNSLLHRNPDGTFSDVTRQAGLARSVHRTHAAVWADFDNDGLLDLFVGHEETPAALFRNLGDGTFVDVAHAAGVDRVSFIKGAAWGDYDNDGWPDLYVSNYGGPNFLYHNERNGTFKEVAQELGLQKPIMSFATWFWDYDNDGWLDLFVASFVPSVSEVAKGYLGLPPAAETMRLYRNTGHGTFEDVTKLVGLDRVVPAMGANFGDIDNDGFLDMYLGTGAPSYAALVPNLLFRNHDGQRFVDVTAETGTGHLQKGHGVAFADIDNDGDQDIFENMGGFVEGDEYQKVLFENPGHGNNWIRLRLTGVKSNRAAIGARVKVVVEDADGRERAFHRVVTSGGSFGASPLEPQVGLGHARAVKRLEVFWPTSQTRQVFKNLKVDDLVEIRELESKVVERPLRRFAPGSTR